MQSAEEAIEMKDRNDIEDYLFGHHGCHCKALLLYDWVVMQ